MSTGDNKSKKRISFDFWRKSKRNEDGVEGLASSTYEEPSETESFNSSFVKTEQERKNSIPIVEIPVNKKLLTKTLSRSNKKFKNNVKKLDATESDNMNETDSEVSYDEDEEFSNENFKIFLNHLKTENPTEYNIIMNSIHEGNLSNPDQETIITYQIESPIYKTGTEIGDFNRTGMMSPVENDEITLSEQLGMHSNSIIKKRYRILKDKKEKDKRDQEELYETNVDVNELSKKTTDKNNTITTVKESYNLLSPPSSPFPQNKSSVENQPTTSHEFIIDTTGDNDIQLDSNVNSEEIDEELLKQIQSNLEDGNNKSFIATTTTTTTTTSDVPEVDGNNEVVVKKLFQLLLKMEKKHMLKL